MSAHKDFSFDVQPSTTLLNDIFLLGSQSQQSSSRKAHAQKSVSFYDATKRGTFKEFSTLGQEGRERSKLVASISGFFDGPIKLNRVGKS